MTDIRDLNVTQTEKGKFSSNLGTAHEFLVTGILMRLGFDVSVASVKGGSYDLLVTVYEHGPQSKTHVIRAQTKTVSESGGIKFTGGTRGGTDREYSSKTKKLVDKTYKYSERDNDLIIGVDRNSLDLYIIPTRFLKAFGRSKSTKKLAPLKNNWNILLNWRDEFLYKLLTQLV